MQSRMRAAVVLATWVFVLAACGANTNEATERAQRCPDGIHDEWEECDDGNILDNDACLSSCKLPTCGDEFVVVGVEECDGRNLNPVTGSFGDPFTCLDLGRESGTLTCTAACRLNVSGCGAPFTPSPTSSPAPSTTPTPTATSTPDRGMCGNMTVEPGETCDDGNVEENDPCPNDCLIEPCSPTGTTRSLQIDFAPPPFQDASSITLLLTYPDGSVSLPGSGGDASIAARITGRQTGSTFTPNDLDHALRVVYTRPGRINPGRVFLVGFDECGGATAPTLDDFDCRVVGCSNSSTALTGCTCTISEP